VAQGDLWETCRPLLVRDLLFGDPELDPEFGELALEFSVLRSLIGHQIAESFGIQ